MSEKEVKILISWTAPEFLYYEKTQMWFIMLGIICAAAFIIALILKNYFFALLVPIAYFLIYIHAQKRPRQINIKITAKGIEAGPSVFLDYKNIVSFWIFENKEPKILNLKTKILSRPKISLLMTEQEAAKLREILLGFIEEKEQEEYLTDIIARKLRF